MTSMSELYIGNRTSRYEPDLKNSVSLTDSLLLVSEILPMDVLDVPTGAAVVEWVSAIPAASSSRNSRLSASVARPLQLCAVSQNVRCLAESRHFDAGLGMTAMSQTQPCPVASANGGLQVLPDGFGMTGIGRVAVGSRVRLYLAISAKVWGKMWGPLARPCTFNFKFNALRSASGFLPLRHLRRFWASQTR